MASASFIEIKGELIHMPIYLVFHGDDGYHPNGGAGDFMANGIFEDVYEAIKKINLENPQWAHIAEFTGKKLSTIFEYGEYGPFVGSGEKKQWKDIRQDKFVDFKELK